MASVKADIVHPAAYLSSYIELGNQLYEGTRVFLVSGLTTGGSSDAASFKARALTAAGINLGDFYPAISQAFGCICRNVRTQPIPHSDDSCYVLADYQSILSNFGQGVGVISVERDVVLASETSSWHYGTGKQIQVIPANNAQGRAASGANIPGTRTYGLPLRRLIITAAVAQQNLNSIELLVGSVNSDNTWFGLGKGFWRFDEFRDTSQLGNGITIVVASFLTRNFRNWLTFVPRRQDVNGEIVQLNSQDVTTGLSQTYSYTVTQYAGFSAVGDYPMVSFSSTFGLSQWPR